MNVYSRHYIDELELRAKELRAQIEHWKFVVQEEQATIEELSKLCLRAADALEQDHEVIKDFFSNSNVRDKFLPLIAELRKAAQ